MDTGVVKLLNGILNHFCFYSNKHEMSSHTYCNALGVVPNFLAKSMSMQPEITGLESL